MKIDLPREVALKILYDINEKEAYSNIALGKHLDSQGLKDIDRAFITELVYGTVSWKLTLDYIIEKLSKVRLKKLSPWILNILRLGLYQLLFMDKVPASAACNESVMLSKKYGHKASSGFVNAILRNAARNGQGIEYPDKNKEPVKYLSVRYSHPEWLVNEWYSRFGEDFTEKLLAANNETPGFTVRTNRLKTGSEELAARLTRKGITTQKGRYNEEALILKNTASIAKLQEFREGLFQVQDESSMLVGKILDPKPGSLVIDVCSAPGGKATHIAELMQNKGKVIARDIHEHKIKLIADAAERLGITILETEIYDAVKKDERLRNKADYVLVDAPCTGFGIIRKKPDIKWARNMNDLNEITNLQYEILKTASTYVKPGGTLVYSTCTLQKAENEDMVKAFIENSGEFAFDDISDLLPDTLVKETAQKGFIQLYPHTDNVDGFFIARMKRNSK